VNWIWSGSGQGLVTHFCVLIKNRCSSMELGSRGLFKGIHTDTPRKRRTHTTTFQMSLLCSPWWPMGQWQAKSDLTLCNSVHRKSHIADMELNPGLADEMPAADWAVYGYERPLRETNMKQRWLMTLITPNKKKWHHKTEILWDRISCHVLQK
jgi:hypothetical protein